MQIYFAPLSQKHDAQFMLLIILSMIAVMYQIT